MRSLLLICVILAATSCRLVSSKKPYPDFKYWTKTHRVAVNTSTHQIETLSFQILRFEATERYSVLGRDSWNINVELQLENHSENVVWMNTVPFVVEAGNAVSGNTAYPRPTGDTEQTSWTVDTSIPPYENGYGLLGKKKVTAHLGFNFGPQDLLDRELVLKVRTLRFNVR